MTKPTSTYRLQFHKDFNLDALEEIVEYLNQLGVQTIYASPLLAATPGSTHGYDGIDTQRINPEIGSKAQLIKLKRKLDQLGMEWLQDIVPNHMAFHPKNSWLMDVLEKGNSSVYAKHFDTSFGSDFMSDKLMVPILGQSLRQVCEAKEVQIGYAKGRFFVIYFDQQFPVSINAYPELLYPLLDDSENKATIQKLIQDIVPLIDSANDHYVKVDDWKAIQNHIHATIRLAPLNSILLRHLNSINNDQTALESFLERQSYRLCHWQETDKQMNYRRFFTVNGLICMQIDRPEVFADAHQLIKELVDKRIFDGLRIDHIDGLYNPSKYLRDLRKLSGEQTYIVAEKILETGEDLPTDWPIDGTTGYDFLAWCNNLFTNQNSERALTDFYNEFTGNIADPSNLVLQKKSDILTNHMQGELDNLYRYLIRLELLQNDVDVESTNLKAAIAALLVYFPTYRQYDESFPWKKSSYRTVKEVFDKILIDKYAPKKPVKALWDIVKKAQKDSEELFRERATKFFTRCMQFTGPVMAKGVEDTLMYTYHRLIGRHEVGDHPENFGLSADAFHIAMKERAEKWPNAMNGSATHDTKRGEDQRARLQVIAAIPEIWIEQVKSWEQIVEREFNKSLPHPNDRYFLYQTLFGSYQMPGNTDDTYEDRLRAYLEKYLREGKERSDWAAPNEEYEEAFCSFAYDLLKNTPAFLNSLKDFIANYADSGIINGLSQLILKFTCPGIPDTYQGTELWELGFVDPDNRRPVDYDLRKKYMRDITSNSFENQWSDLWEDRYSGKIKLALTHRLLQLRNERTELFQSGSYVPLRVTGVLADRIFAFARRYKDDWLIVAVPLHTAGFSASAEPTSQAFDWQDTKIHFTDAKQLHWKNLISAEKGVGSTWLVSDIFAEAPFAILTAESEHNERSAGIVMHITSLPSEKGCGDLGFSAYQFVQKLSKAGQRWWQILPLGPTVKDQHYSPYSTWSAFAGNPLLIDTDQFTGSEQVINEQTRKFKKANFDFAYQLKEPILRQAYKDFNGKLDRSFQKFCKKEQHWLDDYALFVVIREKQKNRPWYKWESKYRERDMEALSEITVKYAEDIDYQRWLQYIFNQQWQKLRTYAHAHGISFLGDVPIYVSYDSADVWANQQLFALNKDGSMQYIAGVPPDYFNEDGQLWGMPVFRWETHIKSGFNWWTARLQKNIAWFDSVRLDHFRAFSSYWEVPAKAKTARDGKWQPAPGKLLFRRAKKILAELPFIAEDLGDIDDQVYALRDSYNMAGMKILQFAFGEDIATSPHIPHQHTENFIVYTGTHDNDTTRGWFKNELDKASRDRLSTYTTLDEHAISDSLIKLAYGSKGNMVIIPMQDVLNLKSSSRMNKPATTEGNWLWMMKSDAFTDERIQFLRMLTDVFGRDSCG